MFTVDGLKERFGVKEDKDLAPIFCRGKGAVSVWRRKGVPPSIELLARELLGDNQAEIGRTLREQERIPENKADKRPLTISELSSSYSPEAKTIADTIEIIIDGKTEDERREMVKEIMANIWKRYS